MNKIIKRKIYFYYVYERGCNFEDIIAKIDKLSGQDAYASMFINCALFLQEISNEDNVIKGIIRTAKDTDFPSKVKMGDKKPKSLGLKKDECLSESTHFIYFKQFKIIAIEYNHTGPRASNIERFINDRINNKLGGKGDIFFSLLLDRELIKKMEKITFIKSLNIRMSKDSIADLKEVDDDLKKVLKCAKNIGAVEDVEIILRARKRSRKSILNSDSPLFNGLKKLFRHHQPTDIFDKLKVEANSDNNEEVEVFDLLKDKIECEVQVVKVGRGNSIDSNDLFLKIMKSFGVRREGLIRALPSKEYENN